MANENHVVTGKARLSYVHLLQPFKRRDKETYSVTVLIPKSDTATRQRIDAAIEAAIQKGTQIWGGRPPRVQLPIHDGDGPRPSDGMPFGEECRGHWVFTASCKKDRPPRIVDLNLQDILEPREIYSGIFGRVGVDFFPFSAEGKKGIGCGLTNVQKLGDGEPLAGYASVEDDFGAAPAQAQPQYQQPQYAPAPNPYAQPGYGYAPPQAPAQPQYGAPTPNYGFSNIDQLTGLPIAGPGAPLPL